MDIQFKATNYELTPDITALTEKKLRNAVKYLGGDASSARAYVELGRAVGAQNSGDVWRAEINLDLLGARYRAESTKAKLDHAIHTAAQDIAHELRQARKKEQNLFRRGGAAVKDFLRGFGQ